MTDVLIVGAGPAGLTAAIYVTRAGLKATAFDKQIYGGQLVLTGEIENYPAMATTDGPQLATDLYSHATGLGAEVKLEEVTSVELVGEVKKVHTPQGTYEGRAIILAGGAVRRRLGCPGEDKYGGRGVSYCATCDAALYRGKDVAIVGGGNTALEDALFLSNNCNKVYLIHRRDEFRGDIPKQEAVKARDNIEILYSSTVSSIEGNETVSTVLVNTPDGERKLEVSGIFVAVGLVPESALFAGMIPTDEEGYVASDETCTTPLDGVFVAGDIRAKPLRQIVTATSDGAVAAVAAASYLSAHNTNLCASPIAP